LNVFAAGESNASQSQQHIDEFDDSDDDDDSATGETMAFGLNISPVIICVTRQIVYLNCICSTYTRCLEKRQLTFGLNFGKFDKFSKFFHWHISNETIYVHMVEISPSSQLSCYTTS